MATTERQGPGMRLSRLASHIPGAACRGSGDHEVARIVQDSRQARPGDLFVAVRGTNADGHDHAAEAAARGAAVAVERATPLPDGVPILTLPDTRTGLGVLSAALQEWPARRMRTVGVTGSAGKTTITHLIAHILNAAGAPAGFLSTVAHRAGPAVVENRTGMTTMGAPETQLWLARMLRAGDRFAVLEASSHALAQDRLVGCEFDVAAYSVIGSDHLDYHRTPEGYRRAKAKLIDLTVAAEHRTVVLNRDDAYFSELSARVPAGAVRTYGIDREADVRGVPLAPDPQGPRFAIRADGAEATVRLAIPAGTGPAARFNVRNALCAVTSCLALGIPLPDAVKALEDFGGVPGRQERVERGQPFTVLIDFAHSPLRLTAVLGMLQEQTRGRIIAVFGTSGRSDHDPEGMGRAAARHADLCVITSEDPWLTDPAELAGRIERGVGESADHRVILDRRDAIRHALGVARPDDAVLIAGKGPERTMVLGHRTVPWGERAEVEAALKDLGW